MAKTKKLTSISKTPFVGEHHLRVDDKGRVALTSAANISFLPDQEDTAFLVVLDPEAKTLRIYDARHNNFSDSEMEAIAPFASCMPLGAQTRMQLSEQALTHLGIEKGTATGITIVGRGEFLEIHLREHWEQQRIQAQETAKTVLSSAPTGPYPLQGGI